MHSCRPDYDCVTKMVMWNTKGVYERKDEDWGYNCSTSCGCKAHFVTGCKTRAKLIFIFSPIDLLMDSFALHLSLSS